MKNFKKVALLLASIMMLSSSMYGCGSTTESQPSGESIKVNPVGELPIVNEPIKMTAMALNWDDKDFNTNEFTKYVAEQTNIQLEFDAPTGEDATQKINLVLASGGDYPDVFIGSFLTADQQLRYGMQDGVFLPLNDLVEEYAPLTNQLWKDVPWTKQIISMPDDNVYALSSYCTIQHCFYPDKFWINKMYLDNLGLEVPTTTEEFYQVMKAIKEQDANGNGNPNDEIPLSGYGGEDMVRTPFNFLMNAFTYYDGTFLALEDGKVVSVLDKPEYQKGLEYINMLYAEDLFDVNTFTQNHDQFRTVINAEDNLVGGYMLMAPWSLTAGSDNYRSYEAISPLKGPDGVQYTRWDKYTSVTSRLGTFAITNTCENPEAAIRLADFLWSYDGTMFSRQGQKDVCWTDADAGTTGIDGDAAVWKPIFPAEGENWGNYKWDNNNHWYETNEMFMTDKQQDENFDIYDENHMEELIYKETAKYTDYAPADVLPTVNFTIEESEELSIIKTEILKYAKETQIQFITGELNVNSDWDMVVGQLKNLGLDRWVELYQQAYDRQFK